MSEKIVLPKTHIMRMGDLPHQEGMPQLSEKEKNMVMHVVLPILGGIIGAYA